MQLYSCDMALAFSFCDGDTSCDRDFVIVNVKWLALRQMMTLSGLGCKHRFAGSCILVCAEGSFNLLHQNSRRLKVCDASRH